MAETRNGPRPWSVPGDGDFTRRVLTSPGILRQLRRIRPCSHLSEGIETNKERDSSRKLFTQMTTESEELTADQETPVVVALATDRCLE